MKELILSVLSLIILLPIIFFLPLGLSNKGKGIIVIASFLLANIGFLTQGVIPLWLLWLILALLVFLISYVIQGRFGDALFAGTPANGQSNDLTNDQKNNMILQNQRSSVEDHKEDSHNAYSVQYEEDQAISDSEEELLVFSDEKHPSEDGDDFITSEQSDTEYDVSEMTENKDEILADDGEEDDLSALIEQMDTSFLNEREKDWTGMTEAEEGLKEEQEVDEGQEPDYMAEIEKFLEEDDQELVFDDDNEEILEEREKENADLALEEIPIDDFDAPVPGSSDLSQTVSEDEVELEDLSGSLFGSTDELTSEMDEDEEMPSEMLHKEEEMDDLSVHLAPNDEEEWLDVLKDEEKDLGDEQWPLAEEENEHLLGIKSGEEYPEDFGSGIELDVEEEPQSDTTDEQEEITHDAEKESEEEVELSYEAETEELEEAGSDLSQDTSLEFATEEHLEDEEDDEDLEVTVDEPETILSFAGDDRDGAPSQEALAEAAPSTSSQIDEDMLQSIEESDIAEEVVTEETNAFQQQMFSLMASQLEFESKRLPAEDYEMLIKDHMVDSLSPHDYYTFASMLIQHYIRHKEIGKLHDLLCDLRERFTKYPILTMEIQYLYEQYCENAL